MKTAATRLAIWLRAPAAVATDVFDRLPTTRNPPKSPLRMLAGPCATSSWFGSIVPPLCRAAALAAPSASAYPTSTMASAPGTSSLNLEISSIGQRQVGQSRWEVARHMHPRRLSAKQSDHDCRCGHDDERRRHRPEPDAGAEASPQETTCRLRPARAETSGKCCKTCQSFVKKLPDAPLIPSKMRHLADDGDVDQSFDETAHHGCGDEARDPPMRMIPKLRKKKPIRYGERGGQRVEFSPFPATRWRPQSPRTDSPVAVSGPTTSCRDVPSSA